MQDQHADNAQAETEADASSTTASDSTATPDYQSLYEQERAKRLQAMADLDNYRKQTEAAKSKAGLLTNMMMISSVFEVNDDLQMALNDSQLDLDRAKQMLSIARDKLAATLNLAGVEEVTIKVGDKFDASMMEAVTTIPAPTAEQSGLVADVISAAYRHRAANEIVKTARVVVYKALTT